MERMIDGVGKNTPQEYNKIYTRRLLEGVDSFDLRRWEKLLKYYKGGRLIDLGCLDSLVPILAKQKYPDAEVYGLDQAPDAVADMQRRYPQVNYSVGDVYKLPFRGEHFGYVVAGELLEHLENPRGFLEEAFRILKFGGTLALSVPMEEAREPGAVDGERHLWSYSAFDIKELLSPYGEVKVRFLGSRWFPYKHHFKNIIAYCTKHGIPD